MGTLPPETDSQYDFIKITSCGKFLFIGGYFDGSLRVYSLLTRQLIDAYRASNYVIELVAISEDDKILVSVSSNQNIMLWKVNKIASSSRKAVLSWWKTKLFTGHMEKVHTKFSICGN